MKRFLANGWFFWALSVAVVTLAQNATTSLRGVVSDVSGARVPEAEINITDLATGIKFNTRTDQVGEYAFKQIPPATYSIVASSDNFEPQQTTVALTVNQTTDIEFVLHLKSVKMDVAAQVQTLDSIDASLGGSADNTRIEALPSETRNIPELLSLQPGVLYLPPQPNGGGDSRNGAVNGGRSDQGNITIDGIDDNDQVNGFAFTGVLRETMDSIEEFRVVTAGANADSGRSSGAEITMVTKSGGNQVRGAAYEYNRNGAGTANDWFNKQAELNSGLPNRPGKLVRNIYGADFSGPLIEKKLFFFANYEAQRIAENTQVTQIVPTAAYRAGQLSYYDPNNNPVTLSASQFAQLDAGCQICNTAAYPHPPGANPNSLAYFTSMPTANGSVEGDGLNEGSFSFSSPFPSHLNTSIVRIDFDPSARHLLFMRGNLQDDGTDDAEQFPGQPAAAVLQDDSKGITAGDTWTINPKTVNDIRYGYIRQGFSTSGIGTGDYVDFRFLASPTAETRTTITSIPVNTIVDHLTRAEGHHTIQLGGSWRLVLQNHSSDENSFNGANTNPDWLSGSPGSPTNIGMAAVNSGFATSYGIAYANLAGVIPEITDVFNYMLTSASSGIALADGAFTHRHFRANEFEWYVEDTWRVGSKLTLTFGVRHTILQTPYESSGQQVAPTVDTDSWFREREKAAQAGQIYEPDLQFAPAGHHYGQPGYWPKAKDNFAPRIAFAYAPTPSTVIRAGAGIYFDHYGEALVNIFDQNGSYGTNSMVNNPGGVYSMEGDSSNPPAPRFLDRHTLPNISVGAAPSSISFPFTAPLGNFATTWGLDNKLKTPYSETMDFTVQRELGGGIALEAAYVGRLGRHLLQQLDLAEPVDYVDPGGGGDYYTAGSKLSHLVDVNGGNATASVAAIPYFEHVFPFMAGTDYPGESATQAIYTNEWAPKRSQYGATTALSDIDFYCNYGCPANWQPHFWQDQFSSLYALSTIGMSYYNSAQLTLRLPHAHGLAADAHYTWSHSIDLGSDTERSFEFGNPATNTASLSEILNTWIPRRNRGSSDFDTRHLLAADWVYKLPVGRGERFAADSSRLLDGLVGGWQWSGIARWSSALPFSVIEPGWTTDWEVQSFAVPVAPISMHRHFDQNGNPQFFANPSLVNGGVANGTPLRLPYPGEAGPRNNYRGDGYFGSDFGLSKTWKVNDGNSLNLHWETYNVTNTVRFDPASISNQLTSGSLGIPDKTLSVPRRMQFAIRYEF